LKQLFDAYYKGDFWTKPIIETFIDSLSMSIIATHAMIDPEIVVLRGSVADLARKLIDEIRQRVGSKIKIEISQIERHAEMLGGAVDIMYQALDYCCLRSMH
jgi:predicted NBD/HSP70 family sugar kinase